MVELRAAVTYLMDSNPQDELNLETSLQQYVSYNTLCQYYLDCRASYVSPTARWADAVSTGLTRLLCLGVAEPDQSETSTLGNLPQVTPILIRLHSVYT